MVRAKVEKVTKRRPSGGMMKCKIRSKGRKMHLKMADLRGCTKERQLQQGRKRGKKVVAKSNWEAGI